MELDYNKEKWRFIRVFTKNISQKLSEVKHLKVKIIESQMTQKYKEIFFKWNKTCKNVPLLGNVLKTRARHFLNLNS